MTHTLYLEHTTLYYTTTIETPTFVFLFIFPLSPSLKREREKKT